MLQSFDNPSRPGDRAGLTLVEVLIVVVILGILAGIVFPQYQAIHREARAKSQATNVRTVRELIQVHRNSGEYPRNTNGFPLTISPGWFQHGAIPENAWTSIPMQIEIVNAGADQIYPAIKTFAPGVPGALDAWYNADNGHFCSRVPTQVTDQETLDLFNLANAADATSLAQTTR